MQINHARNLARMNFTLFMDRFACRRASVIRTKPLFNGRPFVSVAVERWNRIFHEALRNLAHEK